MTYSFNDMIEMEINKEFERIKSKIIGGRLLGKTVTEYDIKSMVVASYYAGQFGDYFTKVEVQDDRT